MRTEPVNFFSEGCKLGAFLCMPDGPIEGRRPAIVQGPGWMGLKDGKVYRQYHRAFADAGYLVLVFDYRGWGDSEGDSRVLDLREQIKDWRNAITYLQTRPDVDPNLIGAFGTGGTGGGNAVYVAAVDKRIRCVVSQFPVADGEDWLHRMRREYEWVDFLARVDQDRRRRVTEGTSEMVNLKEELMIATPERKATSVKKDVDSRVPTHVELRSADSILEYKPIDLVHRISPRALMVIGLDPDAVTPYSHPLGLFERAGTPKRLVVQRETTHYRALEEYGPVVAPLMVDWFNKYLSYGAIEVRENLAQINDVIYVPKPESAAER